MKHHHRYKRQMPHAVHEAENTPSTAHWTETKNHLQTHKLKGFFFLVFVIPWSVFSPRGSRSVRMVCEWGECRMLNENVNYRNAEQTLSVVWHLVCVCARCTLYNEASAWNTLKPIYTSDTVRVRSITTRIETCSFSEVLLHMSFVHFHFGLSIVSCGYRLLSLHLKIQSTPYSTRCSCVCVCARSPLRCSVIRWFRCIVFSSSSSFAPEPEPETVTVAAAAPDTTHIDDLQFKCISLVVFNSFRN